MSLTSEIKITGIVIIIAVAVTVLMFAIPRNTLQIPLFKAAPPSPVSELHCARVKLTNQEDGTIEVFCQDTNRRKVIVYCNSVKTRPAADGTSTVQCY